MPRDGNRLPYTLNIIDTPGFGYAIEFERDQRTIDQIRQLFLETGTKGVRFLDAVCFIVRAPDTRLTVAQKYMFCSILSLFGKDIESNICTLITFANGAEPPVFGSLKKAGIPLGPFFEFNNSALFAENKNLTSTSLSQMTWDMGFKSFEKFIEEINHFKTRSLSLTREVLKERNQLKNVIDEILPKVKGGLIKLSELRDELDLLKTIQNDIENNKNFEYELDVTYQKMVDSDEGHLSTNCLNCNFTCHCDCDTAYDALRNCCAMKDGNCTVCPQKCHWTNHKLANYKFTYDIKKTKETFESMKKKYEEAIGQKLTHEALIQNTLIDVKKMFVTVEKLMTKLNCCKSKLKEIELRPDPLYMQDLLDSMIQAENCENMYLPGHQSQVKKLCNLKHISEINKDCERFYALFDLIQQEKVL